MISINDISGTLYSNLHAVCRELNQLFCKNTFRNTIKESNSLDPVQA